MTEDDVRAILAEEIEEGAEDTRASRIFGEINAKAERVTELETKVNELTEKITGLIDTNSKLANTIKYAKPEEKEPPKDEASEFEFADLENLYEE